MARYRVYRAGWYPEKTKEILATDLSFEEAQRRAAAEYEVLKSRDPRVQGRFCDDVVGFELENKANLDRIRGAT